MSEEKEDELVGEELRECSPPEWKVQWTTQPDYPEREYEGEYDGFLFPQTLHRSVLEKVESICEPIGPFGLVALSDKTAYGVSRSRSGRVVITAVGEEKETHHIVLEPEESRWLRETLEKMGY